MVQKYALNGFEPHQASAFTTSTPQQMHVSQAQSEVEN